MTNQNQDYEEPTSAFVGDIGLSVYSDDDIEHGGAEVQDIIFSGTTTELMRLVGTTEEAASRQRKVYNEADS